MQHAQRLLRIIEGDDALTIFVDQGKSPGGPFLLHRKLAVKAAAAGVESRYVSLARIAHNDKLRAMPFCATDFANALRFSTFHGVALAQRQAIPISTE